MTEKICNTEQCNNGYFNCAGCLPNDDINILTIRQLLSVLFVKTRINGKIFLCNIQFFVLFKF